MKKYEVCPECQSIFVEWDSDYSRYRCLMDRCGWVEGYEILYPKRFPNALKALGSGSRNVAQGMRT